MRCLTTVARLVGSVRQAGRFGVRAGEPGVDMAVLHERVDRIVEELRLGTEELLSEAGVTLVRGRGSVLAPGTVEVRPAPRSPAQGGAAGESFQVRARSVVLATGSIPAPLPIEGVHLPGVIGTEEAIALREVPARIAILGSAPYHLELAQYLCALGSRVTLVEGGERLLVEADREISQRLGRLLHDAGIAIVRRAAVEAIRQGDGCLVVALRGGAGELAVDRVLAARRLPHAAGLGLRQLGVRTEQGAVQADERMRTNVPGLYAVGDVTAGPMWSHKAHAEGVVAAENAMGLASAVRGDVLPRCVYTWPEAAWVGLTEEQAVERGIEVAVGRFPTAINPYAMILDQPAGMVKVVASARHGKILGVHIVAPGAVDLINTAVAAMLSEATVRELMRLLPGHPSLGEALVDAALDVEGRSLHLPGPQPAAAARR
jgi:dihydrolipoamide dehydrogenase